LRQANVVKMYGFLQNFICYAYKMEASVYKEERFRNMSIQTRPDKLTHIVPPDFAHASSVNTDRQEPEPQADAAQSASPEIPHRSRLERLADFVMTHVGAPVLPWQTAQYHYVPARGNIHGKDEAVSKRIWWHRGPQSQ